jgi:hypothetical protein
VYTSLPFRTALQERIYRDDLNLQRAWPVMARHDRPPDLSSLGFLILIWLNFRQMKTIKRLAGKNRDRELSCEDIGCIPVCSPPSGPDWAPIFVLSQPSRKRGLTKADQALLYLSIIN